MHGFMNVNFKTCRIYQLRHNSPQWARASSFTMFLDHTQRCTTVGRTPLDEWSARRRDLYLTTHNTHNRQTSIPPVGFEPTISAGERPLGPASVTEYQTHKWSGISRSLQRRWRFNFWRWQTFHFLCHQRTGYVTHPVSVCGGAHALSFE